MVRLGRMGMCLIFLGVISRFEICIYDEETNRGGRRLILYMISSFLVGNGNLFIFRRRFLFFSLLFFWRLFPQSVAGEHYHIITHVSHVCGLDLELHMKRCWGMNYWA